MNNEFLYNNELIFLFKVDFGHIKIPDNFEVPKEKNLGPLSSLAHGVRSGDVIVKNSKTIYISELYYDGAGPGIDCLLHDYITSVFLFLTLRNSNKSFREFEAVIIVFQNRRF